MNIYQDQPNERTPSALATLATVGAAIAGAAVGALVANAILPNVWIVLAVGLVAHLFGMVGVRRILAASGYDPPAWQRAAYWLCWVAVAAVLALAITTMR